MNGGTGRLAILALTGVVLAGCTSDPTPSSSPTHPATVRACESGDLHALAQYRSPLMAGAVVSGVIFRNTSASSCLLAGEPKVRPLDGRGQKIAAVQLPQLDGKFPPAFPPHPVTLGAYSRYLAYLPISISTFQANPFEPCAFSLTKIAFWRITFPSGPQITVDARSADLAFCQGRMRSGSITPVT